MFLKSNKKYFIHHTSLHRALQATRYTLDSLLLKLGRQGAFLLPILLCYTQWKVCKIFIHLLTGTVKTSRQNILLLSPRLNSEVIAFWTWEELTVRTENCWLYILSGSFANVWPHCLPRHEWGKQFFLLRFQSECGIPAPFSTIKWPTIHFCSFFPSIVVKRDKADRELCCTNSSSTAEVNWLVFCHLLF